MTPETLTGWPDRSVGAKRAPRAAFTAACCKSGWPLTALRRDDVPLLVNENLHRHRALRLRGLRYRGVGRLRLADRLAVEDAARDDVLLRPFAERRAGRRGRRLRLNVRPRLNVFGVDDVRGRLPLRALTDVLARLATAGLRRVRRRAARLRVWLDAAGLPVPPVCRASGDASGKTHSKTSAAAATSERRKRERRTKARGWLISRTPFGMKARAGADAP